MYIYMRLHVRVLDVAEITQGSYIEHVSNSLSPTEQLYSTFFVSVLPDVISLQFIIPKVAGV
jgi:hypothetical protein